MSRNIQFIFLLTSSNIVELCLIANIMAEGKNVLNEPNLCFFRTFCDYLHNERHTSSARPVKVNYLVGFVVESGSYPAVRTAQGQVFLSPVKNHN